MEATWIATSILEPRLNADFYRKTFIQNAVRRDRVCCETLDRLRLPTRSITNGIRGPELVASNYRMLRIQDLDEVFFRSEKALRVSERQYFENRRAWCVRGDILVSIGGELRLAGMVVDTETQVIGQHTGLIPIDPSQIESEFALAYLCSDTAKCDLSRYMAGSAQLGIDLFDLRGIRIPTPSRSIQVAIANKIRKAERLILQARKIQRIVSESLDSIICPSTARRDRVCWPASNMLHNRLDPAPYSSHFVETEARIRKSKHSPVREIAAMKGGDPVPSEVFGEKGVGLVRIRDIGADGFFTADHHISEQYCHIRASYLASEGLVVVGMDGEFRAQFFLKSELPRIINQRVAMISCHGIRPELLTEWLNRSEGQRQLQRWSVKTTVEHISLDNIRDVLIPRLEPETEDNLADQIQKSRQMIFEAKELVIGAKQNVEGLIDGSLNVDRLLREDVEFANWLSVNPLLGPDGKTNGSTY